MLSLSDNLNILVIEDNAIDFALLKRMLLSSNLNINTFYSADMISKAVTILNACDINLVLLDLSLVDTSGIESFIKIKFVTQKIPVIILTGLVDSQVAFDALKQGAQDYLIKGEFNTNTLVKSIQYSIERKNAEENLIVSKEMYRQMFYKNPFPAWIFDSKSMQILEVNDAAIEKYGYTRSEFLKVTIEDIHYAEDLPMLMLEVVRCDLAEKVAGKIWKHKRQNGSIIIVEVTYYQVSYFGKLAMQAQINDVTEKVRLQNELKLKHMQLTAAVLNAQEMERKNLGEELHDNINQILATVQISLGFALDNVDKRTELILRSIKNTSLAIEEIRKLSKALIVPGNLKELGLVTSLEEMIKDFLVLSKIKIRIYSTGFRDNNNISEKQMIAVFRIVQEQLTNILKHSNASAVTIRLNKTVKKLSLLISDNGKGFDTDAHRKGIGLNNIISRAELFNGKVEIDASPGKGCRLQVELNIKASHEPASAPSLVL